MKYKLITLLFLFFAVVCSAQKKKDAPKDKAKETINEVSDSLIEVIDADFELQVNYYDDGAKMAEGRYSRVGLWKFYHPNGNVELEGKYSDNKKDSIWTHYDIDGYKMTNGTLVKGVKDGLWTMWFPTGKKRYELLFKSGKLDGKVEGWYDTGTLCKEEYYTEGVKIGIWNSNFQTPFQLR